MIFYLLSDEVLGISTDSVLGVVAFRMASPGATVWFHIFPQLHKQHISANVVTGAAMGTTNLAIFCIYQYDEWIPEVTEYI